MPGESLRDQLQATYDALSADEGQGAASAVATPVADTAPAQGAEGAATTPAAAQVDPSTETSAKPAEGGPPRDDQGRFAPKANEGQPATAPTTGDAQAKAPTDPETAKPAAAEAQQEPTRVPPSLPAAIKAKFTTLPEDVQKAFIGLEDSVQKAKAEWGKRGERLNRFDELLAPRREQLAMRGLDEVQAIQVLFAAQDLLDRNPVQGLLQLARSYGVSLAHVQQQMNGGQPMGEGGAPMAQPGQTPGFDPNALQPLIAQALTPIQQELQTLRQQSEAEKQAAASSTVAEFAARPENLYWNDVKDDVAFYLQHGRANTLQDAYELACRAHPEIHRLQIEAQTRAADQQRQAAERDEAQRRQAADRQRSQAAQAAAGSVTGAPQGAQAALAQGSSGNLRTDLEAAWRAASTQV